MTPARWQIVDEAFRQAARLSGPQKLAFLSELGGRDADLRKEVESLLAADAAASGTFGSAFSAVGTAQMQSALGAATPDERNNHMSIQCERGHFYDATKHRSCPHCGIPELALDLGKTVPMVQPPPPPSSPAMEATQAKRVADEGATVGYYKNKIGLEPVVGWLVCIEGPDRGRDYRIKSQRNFIGRDPRMDICISADEQVSRENHAVVSFDPRNNAFRIAPGDARGITYLGGQAVDVPMALNPYDILEIGQSKLLFVPFCGEKFQW